MMGREGQEGPGGQDEQLGFHQRADRVCAREHHDEM